jgi:5-methylthioadenosine/S-adenosylhomocysteine deaminase
MKKKVDLILQAHWVLPILPKNVLLEDYAVIVHLGLIEDLMPIKSVFDHYEAIETIDLKEHIVMPGFVNLHTHAAMSLMRGIADDLPLMPWLENHIWPAEKALVSSSFVRDGSILACAEMLSGGTTTFNDMYFYPQATAEASLKVGMRANLGLVVLDFPTDYAVDAAHYIQQGLNARDKLKDESLVSFSLAPHAPYTVSDESFERIAMLAEQVNIGIHTHLHETKEEIKNSEKIHGLRPLARLANLGLLSPTLTLAHCVYLDKPEVEMLLEYGVSIAHCPASNLKLSSGIAQISNYTGVNIGIGTDGAASNNRLDMFSEIRLAALLAKGLSGYAEKLTAHQALEMGTINGAKALNLDDKIGSVTVGKIADLIAVNLANLETQPCYDPVSHLVYASSREHVSHVWVGGELKFQRPQYGAGIYANIEPLELKTIVAEWQPKLSQFKR